MAFKTKATAVVNFQANTKELEDFYKSLQQNISQVSISDSLRSEFKSLEVEIEQLFKQAGQIDPKDMTPDLAAEFVKKGQKLFKEAEKLNKKLLTEATNSTNTQVDLLQERIDVLSQNIATKQKDLEDIDKRFPEMDPGVSEAREFGSARAETSFTKELIEQQGLMDQMKGASGEMITSFTSMWKNAGRISEAFEETESINKKINEGLKQGLSSQQIAKQISEEEFQTLQEKNKLVLKNFNLENAVEQVFIRRTVEMKKAQFLYEQQSKAAELVNELGLETVELDEKQKRLKQEIAKIQSQSTPDQEKLIKLYEEFGTLITQGSAQGAASMRDLQNETKRSSRSQKEFNDEVKKTDNTLIKAGKQVFNYGIAFTFLRRIYRETLRTIKDLDKALTEMAIVTSMNRKEAWELTGTMQQLAKETGFTTTEIAKLSTVYFRQGRTLREVTELTRVAAQAARIAGISAAESADFLTSAVNAFQLSADQALEVSDRFAALAASSASSYEELAVGLSKFAAQANVAGISIDFAMGLLAKGIETTREAPETIGTALKTVIARMRELTDLGKTFEDGMDISRVETALRQVGVALRDEQGQFRNLELVLTEIGMKWDTLNTNQQASIAVSLAGTRQQSRLIAIMNDFDRTLELVDIAQESAGATMAQHTQFMKGMEAATIGLQNAYQRFITTITESEFIIGVIRGLARSIELVATGFERIGFAGQTSMIALTALFVVMRFGKGIMNITAKLLGIQNFLLGKQAVLEELRVKRKKLLNTLNTINNFLAEQFAKILFRQNIVIGTNTKATALSTKQKIANTIATLKQTIATAKLTIVNSKLAASFVALGVAMLTTPLGWIAIGVAILIKGFNDLSKGSNTFSSSIANSFTAIGRVIKSLFDAIWGLVKIVGTVIGVFVGFKLALAIAKPVLIIVAAFKTLEIVLNLVAAGFNLIAGAIHAVINFVTDLISKIPLVERVMNGIASLAERFGKISSAVQNIVERTERWASIQSKTFQQLKEDLQEFRRESQAENFELLQKNRNLKDLVQEYEEIQRLRESGLFGEAELEREADLIRELENLEDELVARDGLRVDISATISNLESDINKNAQIISDNLRAIAEKAITLSQKDFDRFMTGEGGALEDVQNFLISTIDEDLTREQVGALRKYYTNLLQERGRLNLRDFNNILNDNVIKANTETLINSVSEFNKVLNENALSVRELRDTYNDMANSLNKDIAPAFKSSFQDIDVVFDMLNNQTEEVAEKMERVLEVIGFTPNALNALAQSLSGANVSLESFLNITGDIAGQIQQMTPGISQTEAVSQAIIRFAGTLTDAAAAARLYSLAVGRSLLEATQAADLLASRIDNLRTTQEKFLSGDLTDQELFDFVEQYADLFADENFVDAFSRGLDLSVFMFEKSIEQAEEYRVQLFAITQQLAAVEQGTVEVTDAQKSALLAEKNRLLLLIDYQGAFKGLTRSQIDYNDTLKAFNLLTRLGIDATDIQAKKVENLQKNVGSALKLVSNDLATVEENIGSLLSRSGLDAADIYEIVDGVVVLKDAYFNLGPEIRKALDIQLEFVEQGLEGIYSIFETLMNETLALEENMAQERIKVYEDYFAAIDRIEAQRRRKVAREDLVEQLARLEGATDERSRRLALDLRRELNQMDEKTAEETIKEARETLIQSINESVERIRETFQQVFREFIDSGDRTGQSLYNRLVASGLASDLGGWENIETRFVIQEEDLPELPSLTFDSSSIEAINEQINALFNQLATTTDEDEQAEIQNEIDLLTDQRDELVRISGLLKQGFNINETDPGPPPGGSGGGGGGAPDIRFADTENIPGLAKGGMVDYTGLAMLHGSSKSPEAVLSSRQTEMFMGLRDALESVSFEGSGSSSINIENISISPAQMNNNQDFKRAGETLATAFRSAIQRQGITLNTNKV